MALRLDRRTVLRGIGGAMVGLPALECMLDANGVAYAQSTPLPTRYALVFAGQSLGGDGWAKDSSRIAGTFIQENGHFIAPAQVGTNYTLTTPLTPLANLKSDFSIVTNMRIPFDPNSTAAAAVPPAGAFRDFHGGGKSPLLCGMRSTEATFRCNGITSDQVIANLHTGRTTINSLVLRAQPSWYLAGSSYAGRQYLSYRGPTNSDRIEAQASPQIAFSSLFQGFTPSGEAEAARFDFRKRGRLSVLDLLGRRRQQLIAKVGGADCRRLEEHFDEIRALELRVQAIPPITTGECRLLPDPGTDPSIGGDNAGSGSGGDPSDDIATNTGYSDEDTRARVLADLIHMAFVCDLTRVATLQITVFQSHMNVSPITTMLGTPILADQHEVGHNGDADNRGQIAVSTVLKWHVGHYAYLLDKLKATPEGAGNLLDNSVVVFLPEGGHGRQLNDGSTADQTHCVENMVAMIAGRKDTLNLGRHIDTNGAHPVQALISAMQAAGYQGDTLGEVSGNISELFA